MNEDNNKIVNDNDDIDDDDDYDSDNDDEVTVKGIIILKILMKQNHLKIK